MSRARGISTIPISNDGKSVEFVNITTPVEMTEAEWERMHLILAAMKPALVQSLNTKKGDDHDPDRPK